MVMTSLRLVAAAMMTYQDSAPKAVGFYFNFLKNESNVSFAYFDDVPISLETKKLNDALICIRLTSLIV